MPEMKKKRNSIFWVAQAGLLIALLVVVQLLTFLMPKSVPLIGQLFTGTLVNLVLIVGAGSVGFAGTAAAAVLSPVLAFAFGQMVFPPMIPVVAIGNLVIVAVTWAVFVHETRRPPKNSSVFRMAGIVCGAAAKTAFLWLATVLLVVPVFFGGKPAVAQVLSLMFSWPQLVTAMVGGALALVVLRFIQGYQE